MLVELLGVVVYIGLVNEGVVVMLVLIRYLLVGMMV